MRLKRFHRNFTLYGMAIYIMMAGLYACGGGSSSSDSTSSSEDNENGTSLYAITITPVNSSVLANATLQFNATATRQGSVTDVTTAATWTSSNSTIAVIDTHGKVTALTDGITTITATYGGKSNRTQLTVRTSVGLNCIADLSQWKMRYTTDSLSCTQCHTTTQPGHDGTEGAPWNSTNCLRCHEGPHGSVSDDD